MSSVKLEVHSAAEAYRLMDDDELADLVSDIRRNSQRDPITLAKVSLNGTVALFLIDGRNRLKACEVAGVTPVFDEREFKDEDEIRAFVKSKNERRNITKGQMAMGVALLYPEPEKGGRGKKSETVKKLNSSGTASEGSARVRLSQARTILHHSMPYAIAVRDGKLRFDEALKRVFAEQTAVDTVADKLTKLKAEAPDLADLVAEERMKVDEAIAAMDERRRQIDGLIEAGRTAASELMGLAADVSAVKQAMEFSDEDFLKEMTAKDLRDLIEAVETIRAWKKQGRRS